jgi:hypothetical protein
VHYIDFIKKQLKGSSLISKLFSFERILLLIIFAIYGLVFAFVLPIKTQAQTFNFTVNNVSPAAGELKVNRDSVVEVEFSNPVRENIAELFKIEPHIEGEVELTDNILTFTPSTHYEYGVEYTIKLSSYPRCLADLNNGADCSGERVHWSSNFRAESHRRITIGRSVEGRSIYADLYGSGEELVVFVSALHGSESVTVNIADKWKQYLDNHQDDIPESKTMAVISRANPDGLAYGIRWNANHVDLNRNWSTSDWQPHSWWGSYQCIWCGGAYPASEPETRALRDFMTASDADGLITYHSAGDIVVAGSTSHSESVDWSLDYANMSGITYGSGGWTAYPITGDMNVWAVEALDIPSVLVENPTNTHDYFEDHLPALLSILER